MPQAAALEFHNVRYAYPGAERTAVHDISLRVEPTERLGILGPNGGGKSTLLKLALGLLSPTQGSVSVFGMPPAQAREQRIVGYLPQRLDADRRFPLSVRDVVSLAAELELKPTKSLPAPRRKHVDDLLELVGATKLANRPIAALSGGELQRVMIARALVCDPKLLILDEPTVGIDMAGQERFADMMLGIRDSLKIATVVVSHDLRVIRATSDRVACLSRTLHFHAAPEGLTPQVLAEVFSHDVIGHAPGPACSACADAETNT